MKRQQPFDALAPVTKARAGDTNGMEVREVRFD